jgi:hypothetical protein
MGPDPLGKFQLKLDRIFQPIKTEFDWTNRLDKPILSYPNERRDKNETSVCPLKLDWIKLKKR